MARLVMLGNGSMLVGLDEFGLVHDFYYPYVGLENLTTSRVSNHKIGVYIEGEFSWVEDDSWDRSVDFRDDAQISRISMRNEGLGVELKFEDFVDIEYNAFIRKIAVTNLREEERDIRLFMHQLFQISDGGRADTALYEPEDSYILDYKGRCCLLTFAQFADGQPFDQYAIGNYGIEGKVGTWKDAEDGQLSGNAVEHGGVDSVVSLSRTYAPHETQEVQYWVAAGDSQHTVEGIHKTIQRETVESRLSAARGYWENWLRTGQDVLQKLPDHQQVIIRKSLLIIAANTDRRGGVIASGDSSIYNYGRDYYSYVWPRDGVYVFWPLIMLGYTEEPKRFFEFCRDILSKDGYLMHKYQPDRAIGSSWHPLVHGNHAELAIQEDETAAVVMLLKEFLDHNPEQVEFVRNLYGTLIKPAAGFMEHFFDEETKLPHASYDLWEEKFGTSSYTTALTYRALLCASEIADQFEHVDDALRWQAAAEKIQQNIHYLYGEDKVLHKGFLLQKDEKIHHDTTLDVSSLYGFVAYDLGDDEVKSATMRAVEEVLLGSAPIGGTPRYEGDNYFKSDPQYQGNPWFVTTLWLAQCYIKEGNKEAAAMLISWMENLALEGGVWPEQIHPETGAPLGVAPLVWSHAEYIRTVLQYHQT